MPAKAADGPAKKVCQVCGDLAEFHTYQVVVRRGPQHGEFRERLADRFDHRYYCRKHQPKIAGAPQQKDQPKVPTESFEELGLTARERRVLERGDIRTVSDLIHCSQDDLLELRGAKEALLTRIRECLAKHKLRLTGD